MLNYNKYIPDYTLRKNIYTKYFYPSVNSISNITEYYDKSL